MIVHIPTLETQRLRLRRLQSKDLPLYFSRLWSREDIARHMLWEPHKTLEESAASLQKAIQRYETGEAIRFCIALKDTDALIGIIDLLRFDEKNRTCSFAYMIAREFWDRGFATEAVKAAFAFAFDTLGIEAITADHFAENPASGAVMEKAGMVYQRTLPARYEKHGILHDAREYHITKKQWNMQKDNR